MSMGAPMPRDCAATNDATTAVRRLAFGKPLWINMIGHIGHGVLREALCTTVRF
jgi:hypothetical protein